jgi:adenylate cyclase
MRQQFQRWLVRLGERVGLPDDDEVVRLQRVVLVLGQLIALVVMLLQVGGYYLIGMRPSLITVLAYTALASLNLAIFFRTRHLPSFRFVVLLLALVEPAASQLILGGYGASGALVVWAVVVPVGALVAGGKPLPWLLGVAAVVALTGVLNPAVIELAPPLVPAVRAGLYFVNISLVFLFLFVLLCYYVIQLEAARSRADSLLLNILPLSIAQRLKESPTTIADGFAEVSVLFADIVGFTELSDRADPVQVVNMLNDIFSDFDDLTAQHGLEKIKTIGDAYMLAAGLPTPRPDHAQAVAAMALDMLASLAHHRDFNGEPIQVRIGINSGPVVAGVIGRQKFIYDLWGDCVNTASRMESNGVKNAIQVTETTYRLLKDRYTFEPRGSVEVKGKGLMQTYLLRGPLAA